MPPIPSDRQPPAVLDLPLAAGVVLAVSVVRLLVGGLSGLSYDEAYYAFWSTHPAAGYLDHPPMVAWMMTIGRAVFGNNEFGVRAMTVLALALTSAAIFRTTAILADRRASALAVILFNFAPGIALGFVATPDAPSMLFWAAALWAVAEFIGSQRAGWWLAAGMFVGLGLTSKYTDAFLPLGLFLFIIVSRERRVWLGLWQVWAGVALALVVFSPVLIWNAQRQWVSFRFQGGRTVVDGIGSAAARHIFELVSGFIVTLGPVLAAAAFAGLALALVRPSDERWQRLALPAWTGVPAIIYFLFHSLHGGVQANWPLPLWPGLVILAGPTLLLWWQGRPRLTGSLIGLQVVVGIAVALFFNAQLVWQVLDLPNDRTGETRGWAAMVAETERVALANGAGWIATSGNYALTGELGAYFSFRNSPLPVRQINQRERWDFLPPLPPDVIAGPALFIGRADQAPTQFASATLVGKATRTDRYREFDAYGLYLVTGARPAD